jgi:SAM-dependent methyltransferase
MTLWEKMLIEIETEFQNKENFLQHKIISRTISPNDEINTRNHLNHARKNKYCLGQILPLVFDSEVGGPKITEGYSQGTAQHCHYLVVMLEHLHLKITDFDHISDIGGGYGNFYRMAKLLGYKGNFDIADFPIMHKIQKYYISKHNLDLPNFNNIKDLNPVSKSILFGFHSINEMPYSDRKILEEKYYLYDHIMILYNDKFDGIDNMAYFKNLKDRMDKAFTIEIIQAPLKPNGAFFIGSKKEI